jgi:hypothetical protein
VPEATASLLLTVVNKRRSSNDWALRTHVALLIIALNPQTGAFRLDMTNASAGIALLRRDCPG